MSKITTHVLDLASGRPAAGVAVSLERQIGQQWEAVGSGVTDGDGRAKDLVPPAARLTGGAYRLTFEAGAYFKAQGAATFFGAVPIQFHIEDPGQHHHVPLLLSPFGYSTYRGS